jgi:hypothetical protein
MVDLCGCIHGCVERSWGKECIVGILAINVNGGRRRNAAAVEEVAFVSVA